MSVSYDAQNRVVSRTINGITTSYAYDGWNLIGDYDASGNELARYIHGPQSDETRHEGNAALDSLKANLHANGGTWLPGRKRCQLLAKISPTGAIYYTQDGNGKYIAVGTVWIDCAVAQPEALAKGEPSGSERVNVTAITDGAGAVVERYSYDVYGTPTITDAGGNVLTVSGQVNRFMFTGRETSDWREEVGLCSSTAREGERRGHARVQYIAEIGLYDYRNRVYSATLGRFLQTDPIGFDGEDINIYRYVWNDPSNWVDADGNHGDLFLDRSGGRDSSGTLTAKDQNGKTVGTSPANEYGYEKGTHGLPEGEYNVEPKNNEEANDQYKNGQPSITDPHHPETPGRPAPGMPPVYRIHNKGKSGKADSRGCITVNPDMVDKIKKLMKDNPDGVTLHIRYNR